MGGNVVIDGCKPQPFLLKDRLVNRILIVDMLVHLNTCCHYGIFGTENKAIFNLTAFSGSSKHYMDATLQHKDLSVKQEYGDVDIIVSPEVEYLLEKALVRGRRYGDFLVVGYKKIASSFSCVMQRIGWDEYHQFDFEFKDYDSETSCPTEFAQWSQSVALIDLQAGIKGTFHKHLISSILQKDEAVRIIEHKTKTGLVYQPGVVRAYTFAQTHGIRPKFIPGTVLGTYREPTKERHIYVRNMEQIQHILFPPPRRPRPDPDISSFIGLAGSLLNWYTTDVREKIFEVFIGRLFDHKAMSPIDYDKIDDESIKRSIIRGLHVQLALPTMLRYEQLVNSSSAAYYAAWKHK